MPTSRTAVQGAIFVVFLSYSVGLLAAETLHWGLPVDQIEAFANRGDPGYQFEMGHYYQQGWRGFSQDPDKAAAWFKAAAEKGEPRAMLALADLQLGGALSSGDNPARACLWFRTAAQADDPRGAYEHGRCLQRRGNPASAVEWLHRGAHGGNADAAFALGQLYFFGTGVSADIEVACYWYENAAGKGHRLARRQFQSDCGRGGRVTSTASVRSTPSDDKIRSGSGFFVDKKGHIVTNAHVTRKCGSVTVAYKGQLHQAQVKEEDDLDDLALIETQIKPDDIARIARDLPTQGDDVFVLGFPLATVFNNELIATTGTVSALQIDLDEDNFLMFTAPIQPGNSGGPLLTDRGTVIGVVTATLNNIPQLSKNGHVPQGTNFGVDRGKLLMFLGRNKIDYGTRLFHWRKSAQKIFAESKDFVVQVNCHGAR